MKYDVIIIGSGSVGAAAGYYATRAGLKVLMTDAHFPPHTEGSHHGDTRLMRHAYGEGQSYVPLVLRAQSLWDQLVELSGERVFERTGVINLGPADSAFLSNAAKSARQYNLNVEELDSSAIMSRWPEIHVPDNYIGLFEANAGFLRCELAVKHWIRLAREAGCKQLFDCPVSAIAHEADGVSIETSQGQYSGRRVLISAGTWVTQLLQDLPIQPTRKVFAWFQSDSRFSSNNHFPGFTGEMPNGDYFYGFPSEGDALKIGKHNGGQPIASPEERLPFGAYSTDSSEAEDFLNQFLPGIGGLVRGATCTYDITPDQDFIIDTLPNHKDSLLISGLSGHGFKFAPVLGEIAVQFAQGITPEFDLTPFSLARFSR